LKSRFPRSADGFLDALGGVGDGADGEFVTELLRRALRQRSNHVIARAAAAVARLRLAELESDLENTLDRLLDAEADADKGCAAKSALVGALERMEGGTAEVFRRGARCRQMEPVFGGQEDTATTLRSQCAMALLRLNPWDFALELARLLADPEFRVRENAVRALGASGHPAAAPLLLHRVLAGETEPVVTGECLRGLVALDAATHLETVVGFLQHRDPAVRELAALALGESRLAEAFAPLRSFFERSGSVAERRCALLGIATLRFDAGFAFLAEVAESGDEIDAKEAVAGLRLSSGDESVVIVLEQLEAQRPELFR